MTKLLENIHREQIATQVGLLCLKRNPLENFFTKILGNRIPVRLKKSGIGSDVLVIIFHGAVDKKTRKVPVFSRFFDDNYLGNLNQLSISDPSLLLNGDFSLAWYMGHHDFPLQKILPEIIREISNALKIRRVVFFGGSGGGFAALYYSFFISQSIAVATVPQTDIFRYYLGHRRRYRLACWPDLVEDIMLKNIACTDLCALYRAGANNTIIYLQSAGDKFHISNHMTPFLNAFFFE
jgi:hypothetical protein